MKKTKADSNRWLGPGAGTLDYFDKVTNHGYGYLNDKKEATREEGSNRRKPRSYTASYAAKILGRTANWLRSVDPKPAGKNKAGQYVWTLKELMRIADEHGIRFIRPKASNALAIAMAKQKGGVGNSTACLHLGHGLALRGLRVLIVDMDPQGSATQVAGNLVPDIDVEREQLPTDALLDDPRKIAEYDDLIYPTYFHNVHLMRASGALAKLETELSMIRDNVKPNTCNIPPVNRLQVAIDTLKPLYDVILIDTPPSMSALQFNCLMAADGVISSLKPEAMDIASLYSFTDNLATFAEMYGKEFRYWRVLINQTLDGSPDTDSGPENAAASKVTDRDGHQKNTTDLRYNFGDAVLKHPLKYSRTIPKLLGDNHTIYSAPHEVKYGSKKAYDRAEEFVDFFVDEVFEDLKLLWEQEAE